MTTKVCPVCHTEKPHDAFAKYGQGDHVRRRQCKACWSKLVYARVKARRQATTGPADVICRYLLRTPKNPGNASSAGNSGTDQPV